MKRYKNCHDWKKKLVYAATKWIFYDSTSQSVSHSAPSIRKSIDRWLVCVAATSQFFSFDWGPRPIIVTLRKLCFIMTQPSLKIASFLHVPVFPGLVFLWSAPGRPCWSCLLIPTLACRSSCTCERQDWLHTHRNSPVPVLMDRGLRPWGCGGVGSPHDHGCEMWMKIMLLKC